MTEQSDAIQLVIKAPSQNFEDHIVHCSFDWTVGELKEYLSEEYPGKPDVLEQRLIYSGRLLHNHLHLRDVLRQDDESTIYTLHLVCNTHNYFRKPQKPTSSRTRHTQPTTQSQANATNIQSPTSESTLQHRNVSFASSPSNPAYPQFQSPTSVIPPLSGDSQVLAQMAAMQQMYAYYMTQYMQSLNATAATSNNPVFPDPASFHPIANNPNEIPAQRQINQRLNAQGGQLLEENEEMANRDWLDHLFICCRFMVFFCFVYFYTGPERLMIVIILTVIYFLYHEGWFVRRTRPGALAFDPPMPRGNRNITRAAPNDVNNENEPQLVNQDLSANAEMQDVHELEATMDGENPPHAQNRDAANNNQIFSPINFLCAFFSSLIPEPPPPPVNIN